MHMRLSPSTCAYSQKPPCSHAPVIATCLTDAPQSQSTLPTHYSVSRHRRRRNLDTGEPLNGGWRKGKVPSTARPDPLHLAIEGCGCGAAGHPMHLRVEERQHRHCLQRRRLRLHLLVEARPWRTIGKQRSPTSSCYSTTSSGHRRSRRPWRSQWHGGWSPTPI
jgi:hypothetical protein